MKKIGDTIGFYHKDQVLSTADLVRQHERILKELQYPSGLFAASGKSVSTGYEKAWLRDNFYECIAFLILRDWETVRKTVRAIMTVLEKHEYKIDYAIQHKPKHRHEYIHARVHPETFDEFWGEWGNKQNDSIGAFLFLFGELERVKHSVIESPKDKVLVQKLVWYLRSVEYWQDADSGMWEENEEPHASSIGACVAGLRAVKRISGIEVPDDLISKGETALNNLLPRESPGKFVDLALLSLIWPYDVVSTEQSKVILENVEYHLLREKGIIRYKNDHYYNKNPDGFSEEAEWCFGLSWLAIIYERKGMKKKAREFVQRMLQTVDDKGEIPELYFSHSEKYNENAPLGWAESLFLVALHGLTEKTLTYKEP
jgi:phosphorylase kinase alpha/beta subunit